MGIYLVDLQPYSIKYPFIKALYIVEIKQPLEIETVKFKTLIHTEEEEGDLFFTKGFEIIENLKSGLFVLNRNKFLKSIRAEAQRWNVKINLSEEELEEVFPEPFVEIKNIKGKPKEKLLKVAKEFFEVLNDIKIAVSDIKESKIDKRIFLLPEVNGLTAEDIAKRVAEWVKKNNRPFLGPLSKVVPEIQPQSQQQQPKNVEKQEGNKQPTGAETTKNKRENEQKLDLLLRKEELIKAVLGEDTIQKINLSWLHKKLIFYSFVRLLRERGKIFTASSRLKRKLNAEFSLLFEVLSDFRDFPFMIAQVFRFVVKYPLQPVLNYKLNEAIARKLLERYSIKNEIPYLIASTVLKKLLGEKIDPNIENLFNKLFVENKMTSALLKIFQGFTVKIDTDFEEGKKKEDKIVFTFEEYQNYIFDNLGSLLLPPFEEELLKEEFQIYTSRLEKTLFDFAFNLEGSIEFSKENVLLSTLHFLEEKFEGELYQEEKSLFDFYKEALPPIPLPPSMFF